MLSYTLLCRLLLMQNLLYGISIFIVACSMFSVHARAEQKDIIRIQLKPEKQVRLNSPMSGQITKVYYQDGETVQKGKTLISFDCVEQKAQLTQVKARVNKQTHLLNSSKKLFDLGSASETQLHVLKAELSEATATRDLAYAHVKKCIVSAPFSGLISSLSVKDFYSVQEGEALIELVGNGSLEIEMIVPSKWMRWLKPSTSFHVEIDETGEQYESKITRFGGKVDPVTQSVKAYATLTQEKHNLLPGMSGIAIFSDKELIAASSSKDIDHEQASQ